LDGSSSTLTDNNAGGISLSTGTITGVGKVNASSGISASGAAHITANGGTLEINAAIANTASLALQVTSASDTLKLDAASAATSLSFNGSSGTLEFNATATLEIDTLPLHDALPI